MTDPRFQQPGVATQTYPCGGCGARLEFAPGSTAMRCPYCGFQQEIHAGDRQIHEIAFAELAVLPRKPVGSIGAYVFQCQRCAARTETNETASLCQFCGSPLVIDAAASGQIVPEGVLPFLLDRGAVREVMRKWTSSRWFAPSALKKVGETETTKSTYVPQWTFDSQTVSQYRGQRGEYYWVTESYTDSDGKTQTRQVRQTAWHPAQGTVSRAFDDVLAPGSSVLPVEHVDELAPWPLAEAAPYQPQFLAGHSALRYDVEPEAGFDEAKNRMAPVIDDDCRRDIGGDEQQVDSVDTQHHDVTFKLMLVPIWVATYLYAGRSWQILINGRTGEIHGDRPWSRMKIALAVILGMLLMVVVAYFLFHNGGTNSSTRGGHG
jgi:DNA-directed RNA polymerase subunit RPC12/RpoP